MGFSAELRAALQQPPWEDGGGPSTVVNELIALLVASGGRYQEVRGQLQQELPKAYGGPARAVIEALVHTAGQGQPGPQYMPACHMLLDSLSRLMRTAHAPRIDAPDRDRAAHLLLHVIRKDVRVDSRLVLRLAQTYEVHMVDLERCYSQGTSWWCTAENPSEVEVLQCSICLISQQSAQQDPAEALVRKYVEDMFAQRAYPVAVGFCQQLELTEYQTPDILNLLVQEGLDPLAELYVRDQPHAQKVALVNTCRVAGLYKAAYRIVEAFNMMEEFPDAFVLYRQSTLRRLADKRQWDVSEGLVAESAPELKVYLVRLAMLYDEPAVAAHLCESFGLDPADLDLDLEEIEAVSYLKLSLPDAALQFVETAEQLSNMGERLRAAEFIGVDAEWKPSYTKNENNPVSILQLAVADTVFLVDMIALHKSNSAELDSVLESVFCQPKPVKLGYALSGDVRHLASSYASLRCFQTVEGLLDLRAFWSAQYPQHNVRGLSGLAQVCCGLPLNKKMRLSDWERRPLSPAQCTYAALDAYCLLEIFERLHAPEPSLQGPFPTADGQPVAALGANWEKLQFAYAPGQRIKVNAAAAPDVEENDNQRNLSIRPAAREEPLLPLSRDSVARYLRERNVFTADFIEIPCEDGSSAAAAVALDVPVHRIVKTIGVMVDDTPVAVLLGGNQRMDLHKVAALFGRPRRAVKMASAEQCVHFFGYAPGTVPPVGFRQLVSVVIDTQLAQQTGEALVYCGAGAADVHLSIPLPDLQRATAATVADVSLPLDTAETGSNRGRLDQASTSTAPEFALSQALSTTSVLGGSRASLRFIADSSVGRLGRWLRCLGVDVEFAGSLPRNQLIQLAIEQRRTILTRERRLRDCRTDATSVTAASIFYVDYDEPRQQLAQVATHFGITFEHGRLLSRCASCNAALFERCEPASIAHLVPAHVREKVVWEGPKSRSAVKMLYELRGLIKG
eukprot:jgi/Chlat1/6371/Chrsp44S05836